MPVSVNTLVIFRMSSGFRSGGIGQVSIVMIGMVFFHLISPDFFPAYIGICSLDASRMLFFLMLGRNIFIQQAGLFVLEEGMI
jgi:hypothetical protein